MDGEGNIITEAATEKSMAVPIAMPGRSKISAMAGQVLKGVKTNPLDSFFPFDPCLLRMLYQFIEGSYRYCIIAFTIWDVDYSTNEFVSSLIT